LIRLWLAALAVVCLLCTGAVADEHPQLTHTALPPDHWSYSALRSVLTDLDVPGLTPLRYMGDVTFNRAELADAVWRACLAARDREETDDHIARWLGALVREFSWELESAGRSREEALSWLSSSGETDYAPYGAAALGYVSRRGSAAGAELLWDAGAARFSQKPHSLALAEWRHRPPDQSQDRIGRRGLHRLLVLSDKPAQKLTVGRGIYRLGVGARGTYNTGALAGSVDHIRYRDKIQLWGTKAILDVGWYTHRNQGERLWVLTKRLEKRISPELEFSLSDTARTRSITSPVYFVSPLGLWASLLRDRVLGDPTVYEDDNLMNHAELYWTPSEDLHLYVDAALDETDLARVLDTVGLYRPLQWLLGWTGAFTSEPGEGVNENGVLLGLYAPDLDGGGRLAARIEYAWASPRLGITSRGASLDFFSNGLPMQHRLGPDARGIYGEVRYLPHSDWLAKAYVDWSERGLSVPNTRRETIWGLSVSKQLGRSSSLRLGLTHHRADRPSTAASLSFRAWF
jgi:hypothetical protein